jgi:hypothetical protein
MNGFRIGPRISAFFMNAATAEAMTKTYSIDDWVTVATCAWPHEAHLLRSLLLEHDIIAVLADEHMAHGLGSIAIGGVRVMVPLTDRERAELIIATSADEPSYDE